MDEITVKALNSQIVSNLAIQLAKLRVIWCNMQMRL